MVLGRRARGVGSTQIRQLSLSPRCLIFKSLNSIHGIPVALSLQSPGKLGGSPSPHRSGDGPVFVPRQELEESGRAKGAWTVQPSRDLVFVAHGLEGM